MNAQELIGVYKEAEFDDDAVSEMAATFGDRQAMMIAAGTASEGQIQQAALEKFNEWKTVCHKHNVTGEGQRKALVLRGMEQFIEDSKNQQIAGMAAHLCDM